MLAILQAENISSSVGSCVELVPSKTLKSTLSETKTLSHDTSNMGLRRSLLVESSIGHRSSVMDHDVGEQKPWGRLRTMLLPASEGPTNA